MSSTRGLYPEQVLVGQLERVQPLRAELGLAQLLPMQLLQVQPPWA